MEPIGPKLELIMKSAGYVQEQIEKLTDVSQGKISMIFNDHRYPKDLRWLMKFCEITKYDIRSLFNDDPDKEIEPKYIALISRIKKSSKQKQLLIFECWEKALELATMKD